MDNYITKIIQLTEQEQLKWIEANDKLTYLCRIGGEVFKIDLESHALRHNNAVWHLSNTEFNALTKVVKEQLDSVSGRAKVRSKLGRALLGYSIQE